MDVSFNNCAPAILQLEKKVHYLPVAHHNYPFADVELTA
jgi:hypothetical protein